MTYILILVIIFLLAWVLTLRSELSEAKDAAHYFDQRYLSERALRDTLEREASYNYQLLANVVNGICAPLRASFSLSLELAVRHVSKRDGWEAEGTRFIVNEVPNVAARLLGRE